MGRLKSPRLSEQEFLERKAADTQFPDKPVWELPFYRWMLAQLDPPCTSIQSLKEYFPKYKLKGAFTNEEIETYRLIFHQYWWDRHYLPKKHARLAQQLAAESCGTPGNLVANDRSTGG